TNHHPQGENAQADQDDGLAARPGGPAGRPQVGCDEGAHGEGVRRTFRGGGEDLDNGGRRGGRGGLGGPGGGEGRRRWGERFRRGGGGPELEGGAAAGASQRRGAPHVGVREQLGASRVRAGQAIRHGRVPGTQGLVAILALAVYRIRA